jgi:hypothetical protein
MLPSWELSLRAEGGRLTLADTRFQLGDGVPRRALPTPRDLIH